MIFSTFKMIALGICLLGTSAMASQVEVLTPFEPSEAQTPTRFVSVLGNDHNLIATFDNASGKTFQYDAVGNLEKETSIDPAGEIFGEKFYYYSDSSELTRIEAKIGHAVTSTEFQYDPFGRLIQSGDRNFQYDALNMMVSFESPQHKAVYTYDPLTGLRSGKQVDGRAIYYVLDQNQRVIQELDHENAELSKIVWGERSPQSYTYQGDVYTYALDSLGNVIALQDAKGQTVNQYAYDAWGMLEDSKELIPNPIRYRGEYQDDETGFYYLRGRYYDPQTRRFTTQDPAEDGLNWNAYCGNNPLDYVDPSGYLRVTMGSIPGFFDGMDTLVIYYSDRHLLELMSASSAAEVIAKFLGELALSCLPKPFRVPAVMAATAASLCADLLAARLDGTVREAGRNNKGIKLTLKVRSELLTRDINNFDEHVPYNLYRTSSIKIVETKEIEDIANSGKAVVER